MTRKRVLRLYRDVLKIARRTFLRRLFCAFRTIAQLLDLFSSASQILLGFDILRMQTPRQQHSRRFEPGVEVKLNDIATRRTLKRSSTCSTTDRSNFIPCEEQSLIPRKRRTFPDRAVQTVVTDTITSTKCGQPHTTISRISVTFVEYTTFFPTNLSIYNG